MKLGIMQPYFFPYMGYFELICRTDRWIVFDVVQYNPKSWMNRNRILHPKEGWQYIGMPVEKTSRGTLIRDVLVKDRSAAQVRILGQLAHYKKHAPYFNQVSELVRIAFEASNSQRLVDVNISGLKAVSDYLGIRFDWSLCSEMDLKLDDIEHPGQWALKIAMQLGAREYINPPGGKAIFEHEEWEQAGITLRFTELPNFKYDCRPYAHVDHLSILDVLLWNDPGAVLEELQG